MAELNKQEYIAGLVERARAAQKQFEAQCKTQKDVDMAIRALDLAILAEKEKLSQMAVEETGMGTVEYKIGKIELLATGQWNEMRGKPSMGVVPNKNNEPGVTVIAKPIGVVGIVCPSTNPIITIMGNAMCAIKSRNACIVAGHPKAKNTTEYTVGLIRKAFKEIGVPEDLMQSIAPEYSSIESTGIMLAMCDTNIGTGGPGIVKAVNSCGNPGYGVGQGNTQEIVAPDWELEKYDETMAAIAANRAWDLGVPCTGSQMVHIPEENEAKFLESMEKGGAMLITDKELIDKIREYTFPGGGPINRDVVGKTPQVVGKVLGIDVPEDKIIFLVKVDATGYEDDLCREIMFPITRYRTYKTFEEAVDAAVTNLNREGAGHNSAIWTNSEDNVMYAGLRVPVCRFHVNQPAVGTPYETLAQSPTLGCGFWCHNSISENLNFTHFYQTTRVARMVPNRRLFKEGDFDCFDVCPIVEE